MSHWGEQVDSDGGIFLHGPFSRVSVSFHCFPTGPRARYTRCSVLSRLARRQGKKRRPDKGNFFSPPERETLHTDISHAFGSRCDRKLILLIGFREASSWYRDEKSTDHDRSRVARDVGSGERKSDTRSVRRVAFLQGGIGTVHLPTPVFVPYSEQQTALF